MKQQTAESSTLLPPNKKPKKMMQLILAPKKTTVTKVFVLHYAYHIDDWKRGASSSRAIGVYKTRIEAVRNALPYFDELLDAEANEDGDFSSEDPLIQKFSENIDNQSFTDEEALSIFTKLCDLQNSKEGEESVQAGGIYLEITELPFGDEDDDDDVVAGEEEEIGGEADAAATGEEG